MPLARTKVMYLGICARFLDIEFSKFSLLNFGIYLCVPMIGAVGLSFPG
jgi:hypothetical protein